MAEHSTIEWTDAAWNVITGCAIESPGCTNCYAMKLAGTRLRNHPSRTGLTKDSAAGPVWTGEVRFNEQWLRQPLQWKRGRMIFPVAHGDLFKGEVPDAWLDKIFAIMALTQRHTYQVLTKRAARAAEYLFNLNTPSGLRRLEAAARELGYTFEFEDMLMLALPLRNVWVGVSVEDQRYADLRRDHLGGIAAGGWTTWVSYEPALGAVNWSGWEFLSWMVSGGESGSDARPHHPQWHRDTRDFCAANNIAYHFKQWGCWAPGSVFRGVIPSGECCDFDGSLKTDNTRVWRVPKTVAGRLLDGVEHNGFPEVSRG